MPLYLVNRIFLKFILMETVNYPGENQTEAGFLAVAEGAVKTLGFEFDADGKMFVETMIKTGVDNLGPSPAFEDVQSAQIKLVFIMAQTTTQIVPGSNTIDSSAFIRVKKLLCPFPPFWKAPC
jgi:hypothetical protein